MPLKGRTQETESDMSDTSTQASGKGKGKGKDAESTPAPEASNTEEPAKAAPTAEEKAAADAQIKQDLVTAIEASLSGAGEDGSLSDELKAQLQTAYRKVPAARRGNVQAEIFGEMMGRAADGSINTHALAAILAEMVKAPAGKKGTGTRKAAPALSPEQAAAQALVIVQLAQQTLLAELESDELRDKARTAAKEALAGTIEDEAERNTLLDRVRKVVKSASTRAKASGGGSGESRGSLSEGMAELLARGDVKAGDEIFHGDDVKATITADGKIEVSSPSGVEGGPFNTPSAAATAVLKKQDKSTAVNGWAYWSIRQGDKSVTLGSLRKG